MITQLTPLLSKSLDRNPVTGNMWYVDALVLSTLTNARQPRHLRTTGPLLAEVRKPYGFISFPLFGQYRAVGSQVTRLVGWNRRAPGSARILRARSPTHRLFPLSVTCHLQYSVMILPPPPKQTVGLRGTHCNPMRILRKY